MFLICYVDSLLCDLPHQKIMVVLWKTCWAALTNFVVQYGLEQIDGRIFLTCGKFKSKRCWYNQDYTRYKIMSVVDSFLLTRKLHHNVSISTCENSWSGLTSSKVYFYLGGVSTLCYCVVIVFLFFSMLDLFFPIT